MNRSNQSWNRSNEAIQGWRDLNRVRFVNPSDSARSPFSAARDQLRGDVFGYWTVTKEFWKLLGNKYHMTKGSGILPDIFTWYVTHFGWLLHYVIHQSLGEFCFFPKHRQQASEFSFAAFRTLHWVCWLNRRNDSIFLSPLAQRPLDILHHHACFKAAECRNIFYMNK